MEKADRLSKRSDLKVGIKNDNENQKLIKEEWIRKITEVVVKEPDMILVEKIKRAREKDKEMIRVVKEMKKAGVRVLRGNEWEIKEDIVLKESKIYILKDEELRIEVIQLHHNMPVAGHRSR